MEDQENVSGLVEEYRMLFKDIDADTSESICGVLTRDGDWTPRAAERLQQLAKDYGSFMLRNALAISLALEIEDGDLGF